MRGVNVPLGWVSDGGFFWSDDYNEEVLLIRRINRETELIEWCITVDGDEHSFYGNDLYAAFGGLEADDD